MAGRCLVDVSGAAVASASSQLPLVLGSTYATDLVKGNFAEGWRSCRSRLEVIGTHEVLVLSVHVALSAPIGPGSLVILSFLHW